SLKLVFVMLNCCAKNRAEMNGTHTVESAKQLFEKLLDDENIYSMAVVESTSRDSLWRVFISQRECEREGGGVFGTA
ncbi:GNAT family N-acetyltransferase, partial [Vibrio parahaemolyticus]|nr:GNAT family N-acetyltransferase [Vibrio parahaemolyticus]